jgi:serine/threonine protein kinase
VDVQIALKEFRCRDTKIAETFKQEKDNLEKTRTLSHEHIVKYIGTSQDEHFGYVLFPWAEGGSLWDFWSVKDIGQRNAELFLWCFQQMLGITSALQALHRENCRHGDLKPDNILKFKNDQGKDVLVIADLGVSRVHTLATDLRRDPTKTKATTPSYQGPEVLQYGTIQRPRARTYDIWSIGCIFLEFAIWLLYDHKAIVGFRHTREAPEFCFYKDTGNEAVVHSKVFEAIGYLREDPRCKNGSALDELIALVRDHLLQIKVEDRYSAQKLHAKLQDIVQKAEEVPSYLFSTAEPISTRPAIFQYHEIPSGLGSQHQGDTDGP